MVPAGAAVGVPATVPVEVSNVRPAESAGEMVKVATCPPVLAGVTGVIAVPTVAVIALLAKAITGAATGIVLLPQLGMIFAAPVSNKTIDMSYAVITLPDTESVISQPSEAPAGNFVSALKVN